MAAALQGLELGCPLPLSSYSQVGPLSKIKGVIKMYI